MTGMRIKAVSPMPLLPQGLHVRPRILKYGKETTVFFSSPGKEFKPNITRKKKKTSNINKKQGVRQSIKRRKKF
jgi:hypothetical protein